MLSVVNKTDTQRRHLMGVVVLSPEQQRFRRSFNKVRQKSFMGLTHLILLVCGVIWMYPFLWMLGSSLKTDADFFDQGLNIFPRQIEWSNYPNAWDKASFGQYFINTVLVSGMTVILVLLFTAMAGYALSRTNFPGRGLLLGIIALTLFLPHGYTILPVFDIVQRLGLLNTLTSIVLVQTAGGMVFSTFLFMGYFSSMEREIEDAARVDGASFNQRFWMVMFPLAGPMIATVALFTFIGPGTVFSFLLSLR